MLEEYHELIAAQEFIAVGGQDRAVRLLVKAFGENGAKSMVERLTHKDDGKSFKLEGLKKAEPQQLTRILAGEHRADQGPGDRAQLDPKQASSLLMNLEPEMRVDCVKRLATMRPVFSRSRGKGFERSESPLWIYRGAVQAFRHRIQESCRCNEPPGAECCATDSGND